MHACKSAPNELNTLIDNIVNVVKQDLNVILREWVMTLTKADIIDSLFNNLIFYLKATLLLRQLKRGL